MLRAARSVVRNHFHWILSLSAALCLPLAVFVMVVTADLGAALLLLIAAPVQVALAILLLRLRSLQRELARSAKRSARASADLTASVKRLGLKQPAAAPDNTEQWRRVRAGLEQSVGVLRLDAEARHQELSELLTQHQARLAELETAVASTWSNRGQRGQSEAADPSVGGVRPKWGDWGGVSH